MAKLRPALIALTLLAVGTMLARAQVSVEPDGRPAQSLDQTFPRSYPYPLEDLILQTGPAAVEVVHGQILSAPNVVGPASTMQRVNGFPRSTAFGTFKNAWDLSGDFIMRGTFPADATRPDWTIAFRYSSKRANELNVGSNIVALSGMSIGATSPLDDNQRGVEVKSLGGIAIRGRTPVNDGVWHHIAVVYSAGVRCTSLIVDGNLDGRTCNRQGPVVDLVQLANSGEYFVDELFVYRRALAHGELARLQRRSEIGLVRVYPPLAPDSKELVDNAKFADPGLTRGTAVAITPPGQSAISGLKAVRLTGTTTRWRWTQALPYDAVEEPELSLAGWIRLSADTALDSYNETIFRIDNQLSLAVRNGLLTASVTGAPTGSDAITQDNAPGKRLAKGRWHFVAFTYGPAGAQLFIDGFLVGSKPSTLRSLIQRQTSQSYQLGGTGNGIELVWVAQFNTALAIDALEAMRHEGPTSWIRGGTETRRGPEGASASQPLDFGGTERISADGTREGISGYYPVGTTPSVSTGEQRLGGTGNVSRAIGFRGDVGPLSGQRFGVFASLGATLSRTPTTLPLVSRRATWDARDAAVSAVLECGTELAPSTSAPAQCRVRVAGIADYTPAYDPVCLGTGVAAGSNDLDCPEGAVIGDMIEGFPNADGQCSIGYTGACHRAYQMKGTPYETAFDFSCRGQSGCVLPSSLKNSVCQEWAASQAKPGIRAQCVAGSPRNFCGTSAVLTSPASATTFPPAQTIDCGAGKVFERIDLAGYRPFGAGRSTCGNFAPTSIAWFDDLTAEANARCIGKQACRLTPRTTAAYDDRNTELRAYVLGVCRPGSESPTDTGTAICQKGGDGDRLTLGCPSGQTIGEVVQAVYGKATGSCPGEFTTNATCNASGVLDEVRTRCVGNQRCDFAFPYNEFGDPCSGQAKTFAVRAVCKAAPPPATACTTNGDFQAQTLSCPAGSIIEAIEGAAYGDATGACTSAPLVAGTCNAATAKAKVEERCVGQRSCTFGYPHIEFGDPCPGRAKVFTMRARCRQVPPSPPPVCIDVGEVASTLSCPASQRIVSVDFAEYGNVGGTCQGPSTSSCTSAAAKEEIRRRVTEACVGKANCSFRAPAIEFGDVCPNVAKRFVVRGTCGRVAPRVWVSSPFAAPAGASRRALAFSWDGRTPQLAVDGQLLALTVDQRQSAFLPRGSAPLTKLATFVGPESPSPADTQLSLYETRVYGRSLSAGDLAALTGSCGTLACDEAGRACFDRATYSGDRPITPQCGACVTAAWSTMGPGGDECLPDFDFMSRCSDDSQCAIACENSRCVTTDAAFVARECEKYGRLVLGRACGQCLPNYRQGNDPDDKYCYWFPAKGTGETCTGDAECFSGQCAKDGGLGFAVGDVRNRCLEDGTEQTTTLACPGGVISEVYEAHYGRPSPNHPFLSAPGGSYGCATLEGWKEPTWSDDATCTAAGVLADLRQRCVGKASCSTGPAFRTWGDPCANVAKKLVVGYRCRGSSLASTEPRATCRAKTCDECSARKLTCSLANYTALESDFLKFKTRTSGPRCGACQTGLEPRYRLLSPQACETGLAALAATRAAPVGRVPEDAFRTEPSLLFLKYVFLNSGMLNTDTSVTQEDVNRLENAGVGPEYFGLAGMNPDPAKTARFRWYSTRGSLGTLTAALANCNQPGSPFDDPSRNNIVCRVPKLPLGATCPPLNLRSTPGIDKHTTCESSYCNPLGLCDKAQTRVSVTRAANRADDTSGASAQSKKLGEVGGAQQNTSVIDVGQEDPAAGATLACYHKTDRTETRTRQGQQSSILGRESAGIVDVTIVTRKKKGQKAQITSSVTVLGFPLAYDPPPVGDCTGVNEAGRSNCEFDKSQLANLAAPKLEACFPTDKGPVGELIDKLKYKTKPPYIVMGIPITISVEPLVDLCVGLQVAQEPANGGLSAYTAVGAAVGVGIDARGGIGVEIVEGVVEVFVGIRSALTIAGIEPVYQRTISITEFPDTANGNDKAFLIKRGHKGEVEFTVLKLALSLFVELKAWIFGWSVERRLFEVAGFKTKVPLGESESTSVFYTPCRQP